MRKVLVLEALVSGVYVFDASTSPILHISLVYLTALYLVSMLEVLGIFKFTTYLIRRARNPGLSSDHQGTATAFWATH